VEICFPAVQTVKLSRETTLNTIIYYEITRAIPD